MLLILSSISVQLSGTTNSTSGGAAPVPDNPAFFLVLILIVIAIAALVGFLYWLINYLKGRKKEGRSYESALFEVRIPRGNEEEINSAEQLFASLNAISKGSTLDPSDYISFELVGFPESIRVYISCPDNIKELVEKQVLGAYPTAEVTEAEEYNLFSQGHKVQSASLKLGKDQYYPVQTYNELSNDSLGSLTSSMSKLREGEAVAVQLLLTPASDKWRDKGTGYINKVKDHNADPEKKNINVSEEVMRGIETKLSKSAFNVNVRILAVGTTMPIAKTLLANQIGAFEQFSRPNMNKFKKHSAPKWKFSANRQFIYDFLFRYPDSSSASVLGADELATIFHLPNNEVTTPNIHWLQSKRAPAPAEVPDEGEVWLGTSIYRGQERPVYAGSEDDRLRHMYVVGKTGSGKSYFIQSMALQDIQNGHGIAFLDPHGDAIDWILDRIPPERMEDVIYFNPGDVDRPVGLNVMEAFSEQDRHRVVNSFIGMLYKMFDPNQQGIVGPQLERAVRNSMLTAMEAGDDKFTLLEVVRLITNQKYVEQLLPKVKDEVVKRYWTEQMAQTSQYHKSETLGYIVSKFDRFITNKLVRNIIGQSTSSFNFREVMDNKKILLVNLSKGLIGEENAQFLGLLLVPKILSAAMSRADMDIKDRVPFYLYVDEFQNFATSDFAQILSEARKYKLGLVVANQYISQVEENIRDAVFGNIGSMVSFKVGVDDANYLKNEFYPVFDENDLVNLENINAYVKLLVNDEIPPPFSISTWFDANTETGRFPVDKEIARTVKQLSRLRYGRDLELVESEIAKRDTV